MRDPLKNLKGILLVNQTLGMGGAENFNCNLLSWFSERGVPIKVWTTHTPFKNELDSKNIESYKIPLLIDLIGDWKGLIKGLLLFPFGIFYYGYLTYSNRDSGTILLSGYIEKILVTPWAKIFNIPVVWIEFGPLKTVFDKFFGFPGILYRLVSKFPNFVIETSENTKKNNSSISGIPNSKVVVLPCGINPIAFVKSSPKKLTAYCVSRLEPGKGQDLLISAWPEVLNKFPEAKLYFVGDGDFGSELESLTTKLSLQNSVKFLGRVKNLQKEISQFGVAVFPSIWPLEGFGIVLLEAMSMEKPIICFDAGPYNEIVDKTCAILVERGNVNELSAAIIELFSDPDTCRKLSAAAKVKFEKVFTIDRVAPSYAKILLSAQNKHVIFTPTH